MTEQEFRRKYPHSTDEQVRLYGEAVKAEAEGVRPIVEPDIPMPMITVPAPPVIADRPVTTYSTGQQFFMRNFSLADVPPEVGPTDNTAEMRAILLGQHGFKTNLSPAMKQRLQTTDMTEDEMLAMLIGAPDAREFRALN